MKDDDATLIALERKFWQSMVDQDADAALALLDEPAVMVSAHGAMQFDHAGYRKMAEQGPMVLTSFALDDVQVLRPTDATAILTYRVRQAVGPRAGAAGKAASQEMNDTSTWVNKDGRWLCVMHTETEAAKGK